jgi:hypothetical protein
MSCNDYLNIAAVKIANKLNTNNMVKQKQTINTKFINNDIDNDYIDKDYYIDEEEIVEHVETSSETSSSETTSSSTETTNEENSEEMENNTTIIKDLEQGKEITVILPELSFPAKGEENRFLSPKTNFTTTNRPFMHDYFTKTLKK